MTFEQAQFIGFFLAGMIFVAGMIYYTIVDDHE
jgi:hypothetical protein